MGVDTNLYVGAYIKVKKLPKVTQATETITAKCLAKVKCSTKQFCSNVKFCPDCGAKTFTKKGSETVELNLFDLWEEFADNVTLVDDMDILIPNKRTKSGTFFDIGYDCVEKTFTANSEEAIEVLKKDFKKEIAILDKKGIIYEIKYGVLVWYS